jgi:uncharacterized protein (DUF952 family)
LTPVCKILSAAEWEAARTAGRFEGSAVDLKDGFIHLSTPEQAPETQRLHFRGQRDLLLLELDAERLGEALRWEASRGGQLFPHLYRPFTPDEVVAAHALPPIE